MARILVTGGSGFLGAEMVAALAKRGDEVVAFDLRRSSRLDALTAAHAQVSFVEGEIVEWPALAAVVQEFRPDGIVHAAAIVGVPASLQAPIQTMRVNVEGSMNVMEAMRLFGVRRMVHVSSEETYGHFDAETITEDHPQRPLMAYGISKLAVEHLCRSYNQRYGLECLNVRTCWVYGPGLPRPRVPKTLIDAAAEGRPLYLPAGADFAVDHTYVDDLVDGILRVLDHTEHVHDTYHIASGEAPTLARIVEIIRELVPGAELSVGPGTIEFAPGLPAWRKGALDVSRAAEALGYRPRFDIRAGIAATLAARRQEETP
ncbi:MAG: SDR family NAD(P)-dependent oxidoreductase [Alphaproteobacteria bacterium]|jgi:UDP-glucose 4-epimerase|nr:SDR family NAD(P)-dependent oxidoreductase [Alphaproteobacteria bacterium]